MQGSNWPQHVCASCVYKLDDMCKFRKLVIDNQILIEQKFGPVVLLNQAVNNYVPSSFISEAKIVVDTIDQTYHITEVIEELPEEDENHIILELTTTESEVESAAAAISPERIRRSARQAGIYKPPIKPPPERKKRVSQTALNESDLILEESDNVGAAEETLEGEEDEDEDHEKFDGKYKEVDETIYSFITLSCTLCSATDFKTFTQLRFHYTKEHSTKGYVLCCNVKHFRRYKLFGHIQYHLNPDAYKCTTCGKTCKSRHNLKTHIQMTHLSLAEKKFTCEQCDQKFGTPFQLKQHLVRHVKPDEKSFKCDQCSKLFPGRQHLISHIRFVHENRRDHACQHCGRRFASKAILQNHLSTMHQQEGEAALKKVECSHCNKVFANDMSLKKHLYRVNVDGVPHVCPVCAHESPNKFALKGHMDRNHNSKRTPLDCKECGKQFKSSKTLQEHMAMHTGESLYTCNFCPKKFNSNANMYSHRKKKHPEEWAAETKRKSLGIK